MKTFFYCVAVGIAAGSNTLADEAQASEWGAGTNGIQISISLKEGGNETKAHMPVKLLIRWRNLSTSTNQNVILSGTSPIEKDLGYSFTVVSPSGKQISPSPAGGSSTSPYEHEFNSLPPSKIKEFEFNLSVRCKFDELGTYRIIASRVVTRFDRKTRTAEYYEVVSNPISVTVVKGP